MATGPTPSRPGPLTRPSGLAAIVFTTALAVRLLYVWQIRTEPFFGLYMSDAADFHAWALEIAGGDWLGEDVFYHAPLYPYFMGIIYSLLGSDPLVLRIVQAVTGAAACALLALAGRRLFSPNVGLIAGLMLAFYAPAIFFDGIIQDSALDILMGCLLLWLLAEIVHRPRLTLWAGAGMTLGVAMLARENIAVLGVPILLWLFLQPELPRRRRLQSAALFLIGGALALAPVAVRNKVVGGELHLTTFNAGANLYIGNNPEATGNYRPLRLDRGTPRFEKIDAVQIAERARGRPLAPSEVSSYWAGRALDYVASQPFDWVRLMARKVFLSWNAIEAADTEDQYTYAESSLLLRLSGRVLHFGVIAPLALLGVWVTWPDRRRLWLFYVMPILFTASVAVFFVFARYRYPVVPNLILLAAAAVVGLPAFVREAARTRLVACAAAVLAAAVFCNWPTVSKRQLRANTHANIGAALDEEGTTAAALGHLRRSLELAPESGKANHYLAAALQRRGRIDEAVTLYERALRFIPSHPHVHNDLGVAVASQGRLEAAGVHFETAIGLDSLLAGAYVNLGNIRRMQGELGQAVSLYERALAIDPDLGGARLRLAGALLFSGQTERAFSLYELAVREAGFSREMERAFALAWFLATDEDPASRDAERALEIVRRTKDLAGEGPLASRTEAAAYAASGRFEDAIAAAERALRTLEEPNGAETVDSSGTAAAQLIRGDLARYRKRLPALRSANP